MSKKRQLGRGIFPIDPSIKARIKAPKNLLIPQEQVSISNGEIYVKEAKELTIEEKKFIESNYNYAWEGSGKANAEEFLEFISLLPESVKKQLLSCRFIDETWMNCNTEERQVLQRFIDERVASVGGIRVLAPILDLVNHSSFALPLRITSSGIETPPIGPSSKEVLHKYSANNSPMGMWKKYGFGCECIVVYSIPLNISFPNSKYSIECAGQQASAPKNRKNYTIVGDTLFIDSLPIGCFSCSLPRENLELMLSEAGLLSGYTKNIFAKICERNINARLGLISSIPESRLNIRAELKRCLEYEIKLIKNSLGY